MAEELSQKIRRILFGEGPISLAWLLDLAPLLPPSLLAKAISLAQQIDDLNLRGLVVAALAKRLSKSEQKAVLEDIYVPPATQKKVFAVASAGRARRLMIKVSEDERYELFDEMFRAVKVESTQQPGSAGEIIGIDLGSVRSGSFETKASGIRPRVRAISEDKGSSEQDVPGGFREEGPGDFREGPAGSGEETGDDSPGKFWDEPAMGGKGSGGGRGGGWSDYSPDESPAGEPSGGVAAESPPTSVTAAYKGESGNGSPHDPTGGESKAANGPTAAKVITLGPKAAPPRDVVNLGFAPNSEADNFLSGEQSLACNSEYYVWVNVGYPMKESVGEGKSLGVDKLPKQARLKVALFSFDNELQITPGEDVGELQIQRNGTVKVTRQPAAKQRKISFSPGTDKAILKDTLFFPVRTPGHEGPHRLRLNFYCEHILVQSHLITARVTPEPMPSKKAVSAVVDYSLSQKLSPAHLASLAEQPHLLSMMLNSSDDGSYNIRFFGGGDAAGVGLVKDDAPIDADEIKGFLDWARSAMHKVAWDKEEEWDEKNKWPYRYQKENFDAPKLAKDLAYLARAGGRIYWGILDNLKLDSDKLEELMSKSGLVQIALKLSPPAVLPAAIIYDYAWDSDAFEDFDNTPFTLCETFQKGIDAATNGLAALEDCLCFKGECSLKAQIKAIQKDPDKSLRDLPPIICPSGFWGYRHALGFPLTIGNELDSNPVINYDKELRVVAGVSTDPELVERDNHINRLKVLTKAVGLDRDESYGGILKRLKATKPHLIYFYCHGGVRLNKLPYLEVGMKDRFAPENFMKEGIRWASNPRPLVFINGCHTTSLNPEIALNFVTPLVQLGGASGVIGTEITIFEPLAVKFAEECLQRFLGAPPYQQGMPIGQAVRGARLELLRRGNPLGLVYIPFVMASLRMMEGANPN